MNDQTHSTTSETAKPVSRSAETLPAEELAQPLPLIEAEPSHFSPRAILQMQRLAGNRAVQRMLQIGTPSSMSIQRGKRTLAQSNDDSDSEDASNDNAAVKHKRTENISVNYWLRSVVSPVAAAANVSATDISLGKVAISTKRRPTAQEPQQGDHIVAWSAMVQYWTRSLTETLLTDALKLLKQWLVEDQVYEDKAQDGANTDKTRRQQALTLVSEIETTPASLDTIMNKFEVALSLFVIANQHSSFATVGKASGGHGEADAMKTLQMYDSSASKDESSVQEQPVAESALKLLDSGKVHAKTDLMAKVVSTWFRMLEKLFPTLASKKFATLKATQVSGSTVDAWLTTWDTLYQSKKGDFHENDGKLKSTHKVTIDDSLLKRETLVQTILAPTLDGNAVLYKASEVNLTRIEIPDDRANTQFAPNQGAHTVSWTFKRRSLMNLFTSQTVFKALETLAELKKKDAESLTFDEGRPDVKKTIESHFSTIDSQIVKLKEDTTKLSVSDWKQRLSALLALYVEANQLLPSTTYAGAYTPTGHGEGATNATFFDYVYNYDDMVGVVHKFLDIGIFYKPLLKDAERYASDRKLGDPLADGDTSSLNEIVSNFEAKKQDKKNKQAHMTAEDLAMKEADLKPHRIFEKIIVLSQFRYSSLNPILAELDINGFDDVLKMVYATIELLNKGLNKENLVEGVQTADAEQNNAIDNFLKGQFNGYIDADQDEDADNELARLQKNLLNRMKKLVDAIINIRSHNPEVKAEAAKRQLALNDELQKPKEYAKALLKEQMPLVQKIVGDFWHHLPHFHKQFYDEFKTKEDDKKLVLKRIFRGPLELNDPMIGKPLQIHLMDAYKKFMVDFQINLETELEGAAPSLMKNN